MVTKKEMNIFYKKVLNKHFSFDLSEKIILLINKQSIQWEILKINIINKLKENLFHNLLYFRKKPLYIYYKKNNDYYRYRQNQTTNFKTIICKKNTITLKWNNPIVWSWDENDNINDWDWFNSTEE